jgi:TRAP-type C4-dicarboxylate transport system permease small subunit
MMKRLINGHCRLLDWTIALVLALMVILEFGNVVLRYALNSGITMSEEMSRWLFV